MKNGALVLLGLSTLAFIVAPYVAALGLMVLVVWLGLAYRQRPLLFRVAAALGAASLVFSDALIGQMVFVDPETPLIFLILPTYVLAIILLSESLLFWPEVWVREDASLAAASHGE